MSIKFLPVLGVILLAVTFNSAYAEEDGNHVKSWLETFIQSAITAFKSMINESELEPDTQEQTNNFLDSSGEVGIMISSLWVSMHETIIEGVSILGGNSIDKGWALLISMVLGTILIIFVLWKFIKHAWRIIVAVLVVIAIIWMIPVQNLSL